jgi:tetratricopeptide (TPR) repeat protein
VISIRTASKGRLPLAILLFYSLAIAAHYDLAKTKRISESSISQIVYLPQASYLKPLSFGYASLVSDFVYIWSIQYYGDPTFHPRVQFLPQTYQLITDLDPHYLDAYETGALFLFYEGQNPRAALVLLDKGLANNPTEWVLPVDAGFYCVMSLHNYALSAQYFEKAVRIPDAPDFAKRMLAGVEFRKGDKRAALEMWTEVYEHADSATSKQTAYQHVHDLKILIDLEEMKKAIDAFQRDEGHYPLNLNQLASSRLIAEVPQDPEGNSYEYDVKTGKVKYSKQLMKYARYQ